MSNAAGTADAMAALGDTRRELAHAFDGLTAYLRSPARGVWTTPDGREEQDDVVMVEVVTERFDRMWWRGYAAVLAKRFGQDEIHIRALAIQTLHPFAPQSPMDKKSPTSSVDVPSVEADDDKVNPGHPSQPRSEQERVSGAMSPRLTMRSRRIQSSIDASVLEEG
jgi:hypothetical protein